MKESRSERARARYASVGTVYPIGTRVATSSGPWLGQKTGTITVAQPSKRRGPAYGKYTVQMDDGHIIRTSGVHLQVLSTPPKATPPRPDLRDDPR